MAAGKESGTHLTTLLIAPPEPTYPTGGFLFNAAVDYHLRDRPDFRYVHALPTEDPGGDYAEMHGRCRVILDSLYLSAPQFQERLQSHGHAVGYLVHAMQSQILGGEQADPSPEETRSLSQAAFAIVPSVYMERHLTRWFPSLPVAVLPPGAGGAGAPRESREHGTILSPGGASQADYIRERTRQAGCTPGPDDSIYVTAGTISPVKNQVWLADLLARRDRFVWYVCGDETSNTDYVHRFDQICDDPRLSGRVVRMGPVDQNLLHHLLSVATAYLQPSTFESYGMAVAEAAHLGVPVVANRVGGVADAVGDVITGHLCVSGDENCWNRALDLIDHDRIPSDKDGWSRSRRTWAETATDLMRVVFQLCSRSSTRTTK